MPIPARLPAPRTVLQLPGTGGCEYLRRGDQQLFGSVTSSVATVTGSTTAPPIVTFGDGSLWTTNSSFGPGATYSQFIAPGDLLLTDGAGNEAASAFYIIPQYIGGFVASFTYWTTNGVADGTTFLVQNSAASTNALGAGGGDLGYYGINDSLAFELNLYTLANGGSGIAYGTGGLTPDSPTPIPPYINPSPVAINSGNPINVRLAFFSGVMHAKLVDTVTSATYIGSHSFGDPVAILNSASGYRLHRRDRGSASTQTVSNFLYSCDAAHPLEAVWWKCGDNLAGLGIDSVRTARRPVDCRPVHDPDERAHGGEWDEPSHASDNRKPTILPTRSSLMAD